MSGATFSRGRWLTFCLVFYGIPVLLTAFALGQVAREREQVRRTRLQEKLAKVLSGFTPWFETQNVLERSLNVFAKHLEAPASGGGSPEAILRRLERRFPGVIQATVLGPDGSVRPRPGQGTRPMRVLRLFSEAWKAHLAGNSGPLTRNWSLFSSFIGPLSRPDSLRAGDLQEVSYRPGRAFFLATPVSPQGMAVFHLNRLPGWEHLGLASRVRWCNSRFTRVRAAIVENGRILDPDPAAPGPAAAGLPTVPSAGLLARLESDPAGFVSEGAVLWAQAWVSPKLRLVVWTGQTPNLPGPPWGRALLSFLLVLFAGLSAVTLLVMRGTLPFSLSIRLKLIFLFLFAVALPLAVMAMNARDLVLDRRSRMETRIHREMEKSLQAFDRNMPRVLGGLEQALRRGISTPIPEGRPLLETAAERITALTGRVDPSSGWLVDQSGNSVLEERMRMTPDMRRYARNAKGFFANFLRGMNDSRIETDESGDDRFAQVAAVTGMDVEQVFAGLGSSINNIKEVRFGERRNFFGMFPVYDSSGTARLLGVFGWGRDRIGKMYLRAHLLQESRKLPDTTLVAFHREIPEAVYPPGTRFAGPLRPLIGSLVRQAETVKEQFQSGPGTYLVTAIRGTELADFFLVAVTSDRAIRAEIGEIFLRLKLATLIILLISGTIGMALAQGFLFPIAHLAKGMQALKGRNFQFRIPVTDRDELGELSSTFNEMMAGLGDLEVARVIQESLFPREPLELPRVSVYGRCLPASQVGGDYYDFFAVGPDRVVVLIGDVSGHGVSAALVMAMAKAVIAFPGNRFDPAETMTHLNEVLSKTLNRQKGMTCFIGLIDLEGMTIRFCNAGHFDPWLIRAGQAGLATHTVIPLSSRNMLLGFGTKKPFKDAEASLQTGDVLFLFTDGLIEARAKIGPMVGYERLEAALPGLMRNTLPETEAAIRRWQEELAQDRPQEDDITILLARLT